MCSAAAGCPLLHREKLPSLRGCACACSAACSCSHSLALSTSVSDRRALWLQGAWRGAGGWRGKTSCELALLRLQTLLSGDWEHCGAAGSCTRPIFCCQQCHCRALSCLKEPLCVHRGQGKLEDGMLQCVGCFGFYSKDVIHKCFKLGDP